MNVDLALELSKLVHNECKDVPHDIGIRLIRIVEKHQEAINFTGSSLRLKEKEKQTFSEWRISSGYVSYNANFYKKEGKLISFQDLRKEYLNNTNL